MGILVTRGSRISIPEGGLIINVDNPAENRCVLHVSYDMYPQWLLIATDEARRCQAAAKVVDDVWTDGGNSQEIAALEAELRAGMQTFVAAVAAIDGFYGTVCDRSVRIAFSGRRPPARHAQVAETLRQRFRIPANVFPQLKSHLERLFTFRDEAVHPTAAAREAVPHPRLKVAVERRLAMYSATNATHAAESALNMIFQLLDRVRPKYSALAKHCEFAKEWIAPIVTDWESSRSAI